MVTRQDSPQLVTQIAEAIDAVAPHLADHADEVAALHDRLGAPLRVALLGRVNAGKSTLLNALVGQRVAPTNETECTQIATWYRFGAPARVEVFGLDGTAESISVHQRLPDDFGRPAADIDYVIAHLPSVALRDYELIDTPGLATTNSTSSAATRRTMVDPAPGAGIQPPDGTLFLCDGAPRADEIAFLNEMGATRIDTLGLLSHADTFGEGPFGAVDPLQSAAQKAKRLADQLTRLAGAVLPVSGLLAEATLHLTENDARELATLATVPHPELTEMLAGQDEHMVHRPALDRLLSVVGEYGILHGRTPAQHGAVALTRWLTDASGISAVRQQITTRFLRRSEVLKVRHILNRLDDVADASPHRDHVRAILENTRMHPALHPLRELAALELLLRWDPTHPLVAELDHIGVAATAAESVGLPADVDVTAVIEAARQACVRCRRQRITAISAAEREAWTVLERSYQLLFAPG